MRITIDINEKDLKGLIECVCEKAIQDIEIDYDKLNRNYGAYNTSYRDIDDILFSSRKKAEEVLSTMRDVIDTRGVVRMSDVKKMVELEIRHMDNMYGWTSIDDAEIKSVKDGFVIKLPKAMMV